MPFAHDRAVRLVFSDDPETLDPGTQAGKTQAVLFRYDAGAERTRFLFYHLGHTSTRRLVLRATAAEDVSFEVLTSIPAPSARWTQLGHAVSAGLLRNLNSGAWTRHDIAAGTFEDLWFAALPPGVLSIGVIETTVTAGTSVEIALAVLDDPANADAVFASPFQFLGDGRGRRGDFSIVPNAPVPLTYTVGSDTPLTYTCGNRKFGPNGLTPLAGSPDVPYDGEYVVFTHLAVQLVNDGKKNATVGVYERVGGPYATATYWMDGALVESELIINPPGIWYKVKSYTVKANSTVTADIAILPDPAASMPIELRFDADDGHPAPSFITVAPLRR